MVDSVPRCCALDALAGSALSFTAVTDAEADEQALDMLTDAESRHEQHRQPVDAAEPDGDVVGTRSLSWPMRADPHPRGTRLTVIDADGTTVVGEVESDDGVTLRVRPLAAPEALDADHERGDRPVH